MYAKMFTNGFYDIHSMDAIYIYPCDRWLILIGKTILNRFCFFFLKAGFIIVHDLNRYLFSPFFSHVKQCAGGEADLFGPFSDDFEHDFTSRLAGAIKSVIQW